MSQQDRADDGPGAEVTEGPAGPGATDPAAPAPATVDRRGFVRALAGESVTTAGRLAGLSGAMSGAVIAGVRAAGESFAALGGRPAGGTTAPVPVPVRRPTFVPPRLPGDGAPLPPLRLADADRSVLEAVSVGLLATNQPGAAPAMGAVRFAWDGVAFHIPGRSDTARTANLQRDPHASLTVIDPETGDALLIAGRARVVYGAEGRAGAAEALAACGIELPETWQAPDTRGDPVLVVLEPARVLRRRVADERP
jgi:hypothetical protein